MIKTLGKYDSSDGKYICGICGKEFADKQNGERVPQKTHLRPSTYLKFGNEVVAIIPKMCYRCNDLMKKKIVQVFG